MNLLTVLSTCEEYRSIPDKEENAQKMHEHLQTCTICKAKRRILMYEIREFPK